MMEDTTSGQYVELRGSQGAKMAITSPALLTLWEQVLGPRFRELPRDAQEEVILVIGCDDAYCCPIAVAYDIWGVLGHWELREQALLGRYGITQETYKAFLTWNDGASEAEIAACRAWLVRQQHEGPHALSA